jgi:hypothetical protein
LKLSISLSQFCLKRGQNKFNTIRINETLFTMVKDAFNTSDKKRNALAETSWSDEKWSDGESYNSDDTENILNHSTTKKKRSEFNIQYGVVVHYYSFFKSHQYPTPFILSTIEVSSNQLF